MLCASCCSSGQLQFDSDVQCALYQRNLPTRTILARIAPSFLSKLKTMISSLKIKQGGINGRKRGSDGKIPNGRGQCIYTWTQNTAWWGAKSFSTPPYSQFGWMEFLFESCFESLRGIWVASSEGILRLYLEPRNLSLFTLFSVLFQEWIFYE